MNTTNLEKNKLDPEEGDGGDIPFILCSPTKNEAHQAQEDNTAAEEKDDEDLPHLMTFFLKPRRSCHTGSHHQKDVEPIADMLCEFSLNNNIMGKELADESMDLDCSSWSSPLPTLQSLDVIVTPPVINLPKRRRLASQEEQQEGASSLKSTPGPGPLFPILGRQAHHHLQQQQQLPAMIHCPIPRRHR